MLQTRRMKLPEDKSTPCTAYQRDRITGLLERLEYIDALSPGSAQRVTVVLRHQIQQAGLTFPRDAPLLQDWLAARSVREASALIQQLIESARGS